MRIYPHQQNTGGFFVAVFDKVKPLTAADRVHEGNQVDAHDIQQSEANEEKLVEAVGGEQQEETTTPPSTTAESNTAEEGKVDETPGSKRPAEESSSKAEEAPVTKKQKQDVPKIEEAPFQLMTADNPDVQKLTYVLKKLIYRLITLLLS